MRYPKAMVVEILQAMRASTLSNEEFLRTVRSRTGFERVDRAHIVGWEHQHGIPVDSSKPITGRPERKKVGVKVDAQFETEIVDTLLFKEVCRAESAEKLEVVANAMYSYDIIRATATMIAEGKPEGHPSRKLTFSNGWIQRFLKRNQLRRLRVTAELKCSRPPVADIKAFLLSFQDHQRAAGLAPFDILSVDETGIFYGFGPTHQYVTREESRASAPTSKDRFTVVIGTRGSGDLLPPFIIAKCSPKSNLKELAPINKLKAKGDLFKDWIPKRWSRIIEGVTYERGYLQGPSGEIVTVHPNAWADTTSTLMFLDLMLGGNRRAAVVWDNCAPHGTAAVKKLAADLSVDLFFLPPNMTDKLQVVDLAINGPLKTRCRMERGKQLMNHLSAWRAERQVNAAAPLQSHGRLCLMEFALWFEPLPRSSERASRPAFSAHSFECRCFQRQAGISCPTYLMMHTSSYRTRFGIRWATPWQPPSSSATLTSPTRKRWRWLLRPSIRARFQPSRQSCQDDQCMLLH